MQYRHSDNIVFFLAGLRKLSLPEVFYFETVDLYEKKNIPKVIYCIHALGHFLYKKGLAPAISNLLGKLDFSEDELQKKQDQIDASGVAMPSFADVGATLAQHMESEEERRERLLADKIDVVIGIQNSCRKFLVRNDLKRKKEQLKEKEGSVILVRRPCPHRRVLFSFRCSCKVLCEGLCSERRFRRIEPTTLPERTQFSRSRPFCECEMPRTRIERSVSL